MSHTFQADSKTVLSGTRAVLVPPTPPQLTIRLGERYLDSVSRINKMAGWISPSR